VGCELEREQSRIQHRLACGGRYSWHERGGKSMGDHYATKEYARSVAEVKVTAQWALCSSNPTFLMRVNLDR
jgi:hypothetical protein